MTPCELVALGKARHGDRWIRPLASELGFHFTTIWRAARGTKPVSREIQQAIQLCQLTNEHAASADRQSPLCKAERDERLKP